MSRFLAGLGSGLICSGITYLITRGDTAWALGIGAVVACLVWFGEYIDELLPW